MAGSSPAASPQVAVEPPPAVVLATAPESAGSEAVPAYYEVQRGDTLSRIAARFGLSERELVARNGLRNRHRIAAGQRLRVAEAASAVLPTSRPEAAAAPQAAEASKPAAPAPQPAETTPKAPPQPPAAPTPAAAIVVAEVSPEAPAQPLPDEPAVAVGVEEGAIEAGEEPGSEDARPAEAVVAEVPTAAHAAPDPSDYAVTPDQRITVHADETIGHYAEWLEVSAGRLRQVNGMRRQTPLVIGRQRKLDFSRVTPEVFEQRRLEYHRTLQEEFFEAYEVTGTTTHVLRRGDTLWQLSRQRYQIPMWLLVQYNPDLDFGSLSPGTPLVIPVVESRQGG